MAKPMKHFVSTIKPRVVDDIAEHINNTLDRATCQYEATAQLLQHTYRVDHSEVECWFDAFAWRSKMKSEALWDIIWNEDARPDLAGFAAVVFTMKQYPKVDWPDFPQIQTSHKLKGFEECLLNGMVNHSGKTLVALGVLEGLERVSDFDMVEGLFKDHPDEIVLKQSLVFLSERVDSE